MSVSVGDYVQVSSSMQDVRQLQRGHGEWSDAMKHVRKALVGSHRLELNSRIMVPVINEELTCVMCA